jgi:hypothetical protein
VNTKLTLRLDEKLIEGAKEYSQKTGKSVSKLVAGFFASLEIKKTKAKKKGQQEITPAVFSLKGAMRGKRTTEADYRKHIEKKYL